MYSIATCVKVIPDFKNELVAAAVGESAAKVSADIGAVPNMNRKWFKIVLFNNFLKPEKYFNTLKKKCYTTCRCTNTQSKVTLTTLRSLRTVFHYVPLCLAASSRSLAFFNSFSRLCTFSSEIFTKRLQQLQEKPTKNSTIVY